MHQLVLVVPIGSCLRNKYYDENHEDKVTEQLSSQVIRDEQASQAKPAQSHRDLIPSLRSGVLLESFGQCVVPLVELVVSVEVFRVKDCHNALYID